MTKPTPRREKFKTDLKLALQKHDVKMAEALRTSIEEDRVALMREGVQDFYATILAAHDTAVAEAVKEFADGVKTRMELNDTKGGDKVWMALTRGIRHDIDTELAALAGEDKGAKRPL